jgi:hypothetical protein
LIPPALVPPAVVRYLVLLCALAMPIVAWFSERGAFGPDNGTISGRYPTLIVAAGYAFAIWGPIFLLDVVFGFWQAFAGRPSNSDALRRIAPAAALGFALTAAWMVVFPMQMFVVALIVIWLDLACMLFCADVLARERQRSAALTWAALLPLSLHAGWLALAAFLNLAQVIVAYRLLSTTDMLAWSLVLLVAAFLLLLACNGRMRGNLPFAFAGVWGLVGVYMRQSGSDLAGASTVAVVAGVAAVVLMAQALWLLARRAPAARPG